MAMAKSCPGSRTIREPVPELVKCANCGAEVEIWSDELSAACAKCGTRAFKEQRPSCIDWCPAAKECIGIEAFKRMRPEIGEKSADGKETTALDLMEREHDHALRNLGLLRGAVLCLRVSGKNEASAQSPVIAKALEDLNKVFEFIDGDVRDHFRHEEEVLFPLLEKHLGQANNPTATLLKEHVEFWQMFDELKRKTATLASAGAEQLPDICTDLYAVGGRISNFLQEHIRKENESLLPLARGLLSEAEVAEVSGKWK
jgi:hemerythrin-like domain-containing protein/DNA-directed RNA polymerase subunit RPC12/RpoP